MPPTASISSSMWRACLGIVTTHWSLFQSRGYPLHFRVDRIEFLHLRIGQLVARPTLQRRDEADLPLVQEMRATREPSDGPLPVRRRGFCRPWRCGRDERSVLDDSGHGVDVEARTRQGATERPRRADDLTVLVGRE